MANSIRPTIQAQSLGQILDTTLRLYGANFVRLMLVGTIGFIPAIVSLAPELSGTVTFVTLFVTTFQSAATVAIINDSYLNQQRPLSQVLAGITQSVSALFGAVMIIVFGFMAVFLVFFLSYREMPNLTEALLLIVIIGGPVFFLLVLPSILFPSVAVIEKQSVAQTIRRGFMLMQGLRFKALTVISIFVGIQLTLILGLQQLLSSDEVTAAASGQVVVWQTIIVEYGISWFLEPLTGIGAVLLYYDSRIRKESFDLEVLARELASTENNPELEEQN